MVIFWARCCIILFFKRKSVSHLNHEPSFEYRCYRQWLLSKNKSPPSKSFLFTACKAAFQWFSYSSGRPYPYHPGVYHYILTNSLSNHKPKPYITFNPREMWHSHFLLKYHLKFYRDKLSLKNPFFKDVQECQSCITFQFSSIPIHSDLHPYHNTLLHTKSNSPYHTHQQRNVFVFPTGNLHPNLELVEPSILHRSFFDHIIYNVFRVMSMDDFSLYQNNW